MAREEGRELHPLFFVAVPDEKKNTRAAGAENTLVVDVMIYEEDETGDKRPVHAGKLVGQVSDDGYVTLCMTLEGGGEKAEWIRRTYSLKKKGA